MSPRFRGAALAVSFAAATALTHGDARASTVTEYVLDNGLKVLVRPDHRAPVVVSQIWYKVGASYEHGGITGLSHMLEHMMFKGTENLGPGEFSRTVARQGGRENAFTGSDYTAYFQRLEKSRLETSFRLEAERMVRLRLREEAVATEKRVVMEERRLRTEDRPRSLAHEQMRAAAFNASPYGHPIIGWMNDIDSYTTADLQGWYERWYRPNNATLVVVGDVAPEAVRELAERHFGAVPAGSVSPPKPRLEPEQRGMRRVAVQGTGRVPYLLLGFKVPSLGTAPADWEAYALKVLEGVLSGDDSARLARDLVRGREVAASAWADYGLYDRLDTLFELGATPAPGHDLAELESELLERIRHLREEPVSADELARVKRRVVAEDVFGRDSVFYQAMRLGLAETVGLGWRRTEEFVERIEAVTAEQVMQVARRYLDERRLTVATLEPEAAGAEADREG